MRHRWILPAVVLALLLLAWAVRWDTEAQKTYTTGSRAVVKWERDRWTGQLWEKSYGSTTKEESTGDGYAIWYRVGYSTWNARDNLTGAWWMVTGVTGVWLLWSLRTPKPTRTNPSADTLKSAR